MDFKIWCENEQELNNVLVKMQRTNIKWSNGQLATEFVPHIPIGLFVKNNKLSWTNNKVYFNNPVYDIYREMSIDEFLNAKEVKVISVNPLNIPLTELKGMWNSCRPVDENYIIINHEEREVSKMTFKERLAQEYPCSISETELGGCFGCPVCYGYEKERPSCCDEFGEASDEMCTACWNREIPTDVPKTETEFTKADLKTGHIVTLRNGTECMVFKDIEAVHVGAKGDALIGINVQDWERLESYSEDLLCRGDDFYRNLDIIKVEKLMHPVQFVHRTNTASRRLVWERTEPKQLSISDAEALVEKLTGEKVNIK